MCVGTTYILLNLTGVHQWPCDNGSGQPVIDSDKSHQQNRHILAPSRPTTAIIHPSHLSQCPTSHFFRSSRVVGGDNGSAWVYDSCIGLLTVLPHGQGISIYFRHILRLIPVISWNTSADCCSDFLPLITLFSRMFIC